MPEPITITQPATPAPAASTAIVPAVAAKPESLPPVPYEQFDLRKHLAKLLPSPAAETPSKDAAAAPPESTPAAEPKAEEPAAADKVTSRMAALDKKQRLFDQTRKELEAREAAIEPWKAAPVAFKADPLGWLAKAGIEDPGAVILAAIEAAGAVAATTSEKPADKPPEEPKKPPAPAVDVDALIAKGVDIGREVAKSAGDGADLVRAAEAGGLLLNGETVHRYVVGEVERRYQAAIEAKTFSGQLSLAQYRALTAEVIADVNKSLEANAELVAATRKPAKPAAAAPAAEDDGVPSAITGALTGGGSGAPPKFATEADLREFIAKRNRSLPSRKSVGRFGI